VPTAFREPAAESRRHYLVATEKGTAAGFGRMSRAVKGIALLGGLKVGESFEATSVVNGI